jgi:hypothetical protein
MITISRAAAYPVDAIPRELRRQGTRWCRVTAGTVQQLLIWAASVPIPLKYFKGDHFLVPESMRNELVRVGAQS